MPARDRGKRRLLRVMLPFAVFAMTRAVHLEGAEAVIKDGRVVIQHRAARYLTENAGGDTRVHSLRSDQTLIVRRGERTVIAVADPNPFLFTYKAGDIEKTKTANYQAAVTFGRSLALLATNLGALAVQAATHAERQALKFQTPSEDSDASAFAMMMAVPEKPPDPQRKPHQSVEFARTEINKTIAAAGIDQPGFFLKRIASDFEALSSAASRIPHLLRQSAGDLAEVESAKKEVLTWKLEEIESRFTDAFAKIDAVGSQLLKNLDVVSAALGAHPFYLGGSLAKQQQGRVDEMLRTLGDFATNMALVDRELSLTAVDYDSTSDSTFKITIAAKAENATLAEQTDRPLGDFRFRFSPHSPVILGVGAAGVYSFVSAPKFRSQPDGAMFRVVRDDSDQYQGTDVAAMLTIQPRGWDDPTFGGLFQVGVNPKDHLGLFGGVGFTVRDIFSFGGGIAFQQVDELVDSLQVNDLIQSPGELKTRKRFKTGLYLHVTVSADFTKK